MLSHVPGKDLRTMLWHETKAQTPRHDPAQNPCRVGGRLALGVRLRRRRHDLRGCPTVALQGSWQSTVNSCGVPPYRRS